MAATSLASFVCMAIGQTGMVYWIVSIAIRVTLYRQVLELDWAEIWTLSLVSSVLGGGLGL
ncbi:MAG: hypothetical protein HYU66_08970 [Armatimonadetes bacterium]|nr:hypothetical protein [Armatimonadota bacterium]